MKTGIELIAAERTRQIEEEGWSPGHDDQHQYGDLAVIAATLACDGTDANVEDPLERGSDSDPWGLLKKHGLHGTKPNRIRALAIAGALIAAELDREQRLIAKCSK